MRISSAFRLAARPTVLSAAAARLVVVVALASLALCSCRSVKPTTSNSRVSPAISSVAFKEQAAADADETDEASSDDEAMDAGEATGDDNSAMTSDEPAETDENAADATDSEAMDATGEGDEEIMPELAKPQAPEAEKLQTAEEVVPAPPAPEPGGQQTHVHLTNPGPDPKSNRAVVRAKNNLPVAPLPLSLAPIPQGIVTEWKPPGIYGPWPADEYLWDGGEKYPVIVDEKLDIKGLALEDTIVHYDTIDGRTVVEPSNRVVIYSPRFAAVRQVSAVLASHQDERLGQNDKPVAPNLFKEDQQAGSALQPVQPVGEIGTKLVSIEKAKQLPLQPVAHLRPAEMSDHLLPFEDWEIVRTGAFSQTERAEVHRSVQSAITWTADQAVQAILDKQYAAVETGDQRAQVVFAVDTPNHPRLRVIKLASTQIARPGDMVDFTIRFDNIGDQTIGNVTLVDNLTTRLEYVDATSQSSLAADFYTNPNEGESLLLRWEFVDPLPAGKGGVVRFRCKVR